MADMLRCGQTGWNKLRGGTLFDRGSAMPSAITRYYSDSRTRCETKRPLSCTLARAVRTLLPTERIVTSLCLAMLPLHHLVSGLALLTGELSDKSSWRTSNSHDWDRRRQIDEYHLRYHQGARW